MPYVQKTQQAKIKDSGMKCTKCKSSDVMTTQTHNKNTLIVRGLFWKHENVKEEKTLTYKCLDCGHEWRDEG